MKKTIVLSMLVAVIMLTSCSKVTIIAKNERMYSWDYTKYSKQGFLFTPFKLDGEYDAVQSLTYEIFPKAIYFPYDQRRSGDFTSHWEFEKLESDSILAEIYRDCISKGADAITDIKYEAIEERREVNPPFNHKGIRVTGFAIKRKNYAK